jgi:hypothetical protein
MSDGLDDGGVHGFCVSSRSYVCKAWPPKACCRPVVGIAYDTAAQHLYVGFVSQYLGQNPLSIRSYAATFPAIKAQPPRLVPASKVDVHPPSSIAVSNVKPVHSLSRGIVAASSGTVLFATGTTINIYTDIITPCFNRFTVGSDVISAVITRDKVIVCLLANCDIVQLPLPGDATVNLLKSFSGARSLSLAPNGDILLLHSTNTISRSTDRGRSWTSSLQLSTNEDQIHYVLETRNTPDEVVYWAVECTNRGNYCLSEYMCKPLKIAQETPTPNNITRRVIEESSSGRVTDKSRLTSFRHGDVLMTDHDNHAVHAYSAAGEYKCVVVSACDGVEHASDVVYDSSSEQLYVVNNTLKEALVFSVCQPVASRTVYELKITV